MFLYNPFGRIDNNTAESIVSKIIASILSRNVPVENWYGVYTFRRSTLDGSCSDSRMKHSSEENHNMDYGLIISMERKNRAATETRGGTTGVDASIRQF